MSAYTPSLLERLLQRLCALGLHSWNYEPAWAPKTRRCNRCPKTQNIGADGSWEDAK